MSSNFHHLRALVCAMALAGYNVSARMDRETKVREALKDADAILGIIGVETLGYTIGRLTVHEACKALGISRAQLYNRINSGEIAVIKDGKRTFIAVEEANRYASQSHDRGRP